MVCQTTDVAQVPEFGFWALSENNALVNCEQLDRFNLEPWREKCDSKLTTSE